MLPWVKIDFGPQTLSCQYIHRKGYNHIECTSNNIDGMEKIFSDGWKFKHLTGRTVSMMLRTSRAGFRPSNFITPSLRSGSRHRAHSLGMRLTWKTRTYCYTTIYLERTRCSITKTARGSDAIVYLSLEWCWETHNLRRAQSADEATRTVLSRGSRVRDREADEFPGGDVHGQPRHLGAPH
jgi:hypothetical protein